jgi:hypothetical protein
LIESERGVGAASMCATKMILLFETSAKHSGAGILPARLQFVFKQTVQAGSLPHYFGAFFQRSLFVIADSEAG